MNGLFASAAAVVVMVSGPPALSAASPGEPGFMSPAGDWDHSYPAGPISVCDDGSGAQWHAWRLPDSAVACSMDGATGEPGISGYVNDLTLNFDPPVPESAAMATATGILPSDIQLIGNTGGVNGGCWRTYYTSAIIASQVHQLDPDWSAPQYVRVTSYSGKLTAQGPDSPYRANAVKQVFVQRGGENHSPSDPAEC